MRATFGLAFRERKGVYFIGVYVLIIMSGGSMSWNLRMSGSTAEIESAVREWPITIRTTDERYHLTAPVVDAHQTQVKAVQAIITELCTTFDGEVFDLEANGHANPDGSFFIHVAASRRTVGL